MRCGAEVRWRKQRWTEGATTFAHSLPIGTMHWLGATAVICTILSGWQIYNASPLLPSTFPRWMTLGGWLGGGIAWHLSAMWVLRCSSGNKVTP